MGSEGIEERVGGWVGRKQRVQSKPSYRTFHRAQNNTTHPFGMSTQSRCYRSEPRAEGHATKKKAASERSHRHLSTTDASLGILPSLLVADKNQPWILSTAVTAVSRQGFTTGNQSVGAVSQLSDF